MIGYLENSATTLQFGAFVMFPIALSGFLLFVYVSSYFGAYDPKGKHVLVTGGSAGIGLEVAREYIRHGANVTLVARNEAKLVAAVVELQHYDEKLVLNGMKVASSKIKHIVLDVSSSQEEVSLAIEEAVKKMGGCVDILVNCAGTSFAGVFDESSSAYFQSLFSTNVMGTVYPTHAVVEGMKSKNAGRIIMVSSQVAQAALHGYTVRQRDFCISIIISDILKNRFPLEGVCIE